MAGRGGVKIGLNLFHDQPDTHNQQSHANQPRDVQGPYRGPQQAKVIQDGCHEELSGNKRKKKGQVLNLAGGLIYDKKETLRL